MRPDLITDLYEKEQYYWWNVSKREMVLSLVRESALKQDQALLGVGVDIGCGAGYTAKVFESSWRMVGIDLSKESLRFCRLRGLKRLCRIDMTRFSLPFKADSFDLVLALDVIEHMDEDTRALAECRRILKAGGVLIVTVPAFMALWSPWDEALGHRRRYNISGLAGMVQQAGLTIQRLTYIFFFVLPPAIMVRGVKRLIQREAASYSSDFFPIPSVLNRFLIHIGRLEQWIIAKFKWNLPFGLSVISVLTKE
ncbi:MAG: class I SAM-dependent methyltransferase [Candidatus Binatia bacterium]